MNPTLTSQSKKILLIRHGHAEFPHDLSQDFDRRLDHQGHQECQNVFSRVREMDWISPETDCLNILCSPALRTLETGNAFLGAFQLDQQKLQVRGDLYLAPLTTLVQTVHEHDDAVDTLVMVGHQPGLEELLLYFSGSPERASALGYHGKFSTCTSCLLQFHETHWALVDQGCLKDLKILHPSLH